MDVFDHRDYRDILRTWLAENPRVTHRDVMREIGSRDPSVLSRVLTGKRELPERLVGPLCTLLGLGRHESEWFGALVGRARAATDDDRTGWDRRLRALEAMQRASLLRDPTAYAHWARVAVFELSQCEGFREDAAWVASRFAPPLEEEVAADALAALARSRSATRTTPPTVRHAEVFGYYRGIHERTAGALDRLERDPSWVSRTLFLGLTLAVPASLVPTLRRRLAEIQQELLGLAADGPADQVVQVNLQLFPLADGRRGSPARARPLRKVRAPR